MKNDSVLILVYGYYYFLKYIKDDNLKQMYKDLNTSVLKVMKKIIFKFRLPIYRFFFNNWRKDIKKYNEIIIFDSGYSPLITKYIKKKNKNCKIILYFWNCISENKLKVFSDKNIDEFWTFDLGDSEKYKINYNPQFYSREVKLEKGDYIYDALFLGRPKERKKDIVSMKEILKQNGIRTKFIVVENEKDFIEYDEYLRLLSKSRAIIDITNKNQIGLTLRCMESIFLEKKLITNNKEIKKYNFYNPKNIFILDEDNMDNIETFLNSPYEKVDQEIIEYYDFESWLKRFYTNNIGEKYEQSNK